MNVHDWIEIALAIGLGGFMYLWLETRQDLRALRDGMPKRDAKGRFRKILTDHNDIPTIRSRRDLETA